MMQFELRLDDRIVSVAPPAKPKKITGTRLAAILGANRWNTPFEAWCAITRLYEKPFEGSIYTEAGKVIEPKITDYLKRRYFMDDLKTPEDVYGADFFKKTWGDFYGEQKIFGGMWDALGDDYVVEIKTTKRVEDWKTEPPLYYMLQGALYAWLKGFDRVIMVCAFLHDEDYSHPEKFEPDISNTIIYEFSIAERFPDFEDAVIQRAIAWWTSHVETGESPAYDPKADAEIIKALTTNMISGCSQKPGESPQNAPADSLEEMIAEFELVSEDADRLRERYGIDKLEERAKVLRDAIRDHLISQFRETDKSVKCASARTIYTVTKKAGSTSLDSARLKKEEPEIYTRYVKTGKPTFSLTTAANTEE